MTEMPQVTTWTVDLLLGDRDGHSRATAHLHTGVTERAHRLGVADLSPARPVRRTGDRLRAGRRPRPDRPRRAPGRRPRRADLDDVARLTDRPSAPGSCRGRAFGPGPAGTDATAGSAPRRSRLGATTAEVRDVLRVAAVRTRSRPARRPAEDHRPCLPTPRRCAPTLRALTYDELVSAWHSSDRRLRDVCSTSRRAAVVSCGGCSSTSSSAAARGATGAGCAKWARARVAHDPDAGSARHPARPLSRPTKQ